MQMSFSQSQIVKLSCKRETKIFSQRSSTLSLTFSKTIIVFSKQHIKYSLFLFTLEKPQGDKYSPDEIK